MPYTNVAYKFSDDNSRTLFDAIASNSTYLASFKKAVLDSVNTMASIPGAKMPCPSKGAKWQNRNAFWVYSSIKDTVEVTKITQGRFEAR